MALPDSPMHNAANEVLGLAQYKAGKLDDAMVTFKSIVDDPVASRDLRGRVQLYMAQLIAEGAKQPAVEAPTAAPAVDAGTELDVSAPAESSAAADASSAPAETSAAPAASSAPAN
jgi:hypothetical protein